MASSLDVAKKAGVSQATVSRVLNNSPKVTRKTKEKVLRAIRELEYYPNLIARSLVTSESKTIALVSGSIDNDFYVETTEAIVNYTTEHKYNVLVNFNEEIPEIDNQKKILEFLRGSNISGILLSSIFLDDPLLEQLENSEIPYVFFNRRPREGGNYVVLDNVKAARMLVDHMYELGHEKIAYISNPYENISTLFERKMGFDYAMKEYGLDNTKYARFLDVNENKIKAMLEQLMEDDDPPTAIICTTDHMAIRCIDILLSKGFNIPGDVSIAGFDNNKITAHQAIQLTTVSHHIRYNIGCIAAEKLFELIANPEEHNKRIQVTLPPVLYKRKTTSVMRG